MHGRVYTMTGNDFNTPDNDNGVLDGTVVYFQWMDSDGQVSPIFTTKTFSIGDKDSDRGWYSFDATKLDWTDGSGKVHKLAYQTTRQKFKFWIPEDQKSPSGNRYINARQAPGANTGFYGATETSAGSFMLSGNK